jgi:hypothetical protein
MTGGISNFRRHTAKDNTKMAQKETGHPLPGF